MEIARSALVTHTAMDMYRLVLDVERYPAFLSWCTAAQLLEQDEHSQAATLSVAIAGVEQSFTTRNRLVPGQRLCLQLLEGPFNQLDGEWRFEALGDVGSKVALRLQFEVTAGLTSSVFARGFGHVADRLVRDFCERADALYG